MRQRSTYGTIALSRRTCFGDLHVEMSKAAMERVIDLLDEASYDVCVLTGDYRGGTCGPYDPTLAGMARVRAGLKGPLYGVLGDHDMSSTTSASDKGTATMSRRVKSVSSGLAVSSGGTPMGSSAMPQ